MAKCIRSSVVYTIILRYDKMQCITAHSSYSYRPIVSLGTMYNKSAVLTMSV